MSYGLLTDDGYKHRSMKHGAKGACTTTVKM